MSLVVFDKVPSQAVAVERERVKMVRNTKNWILIEVEGIEKPVFLTKSHYNFEDVINSLNCFGSSQHKTVPSTRRIKVEL